jgi:uncharacterized protein (TIGR03437 family)
MTRRFCNAVLILGMSCVVFAQTSPPVINQAGVVSAASWSTPIAPGEIVSIFGTNLAAATQSANAPWPLTLGGAAVTVNGIAAPLAFVSASQINAYVPSSLANPGVNIGAVSVVVTTSAGSSAAVLTAFAGGTPGLFTADGSGCGEAAALNIRPGGATTLNSPSNSARPGDYIALYGTGFGLTALSSQQPPDGAVASGLSSFEYAARLYLDNNFVSPVYAGLAPSLAGVDQINFQIPAGTRNGCSVPLSAAQTVGFGSPTVTLSVQSGGGQCSDPPVESWGQITLGMTVLTGTGTLVPPQQGGYFSASFPSGPGVQPPAPDQIVFAPSYVANVIPSGAWAILVGAPITFRSCVVPGYSQLSAGAIQIQPPAGNPTAAVTSAPLPLLSGGVTYSENLPAGFIGPGTYAITGTAGNAVNLSASLTVGSPIQLQTSFPTGTTISSSQPLTVQWTGGDPGTLVKVTLISGQGSNASASYSYAPIAAGSLTIAPVCSGNPPPAGNGVVCSFGVPPSPNSQIEIQVLPAQTTSVTLPGITGPVQLSWQYSYNFAGLTLGP